MRRAAHQIFDRPLVLNDPYALSILPPEAAAEIRQSREGEQHRMAKGLRAFMVARSRFAEDECAEAVGRGVRQYVVLGAGLDTFAWRNPHGELGIEVFEVDHPATQAWKRELMKQAELPELSTIKYVPVDFERQSLESCLAEAGFRETAPAFFSWLGVVPYLTIEAFRNTLGFLRRMAIGSGVVLDYSLPREILNESERLAFDWLAARVERVGEPFRLSFEPREIERELATVGWSVYTDLGGDAIRERFFRNRADGLEVRGRVGRLLSARN